MAHDEKGFYSGGWDGCTLQWDLNTGQTVRRFNGHGAQLVSVALRPAVSSAMYSPQNSPVEHTTDMEIDSGDRNTAVKHAQDSEARSEASYDPLFDDEPDAEGEQDLEHKQGINGLSIPSFPGTTEQQSTRNSGSSYRPPGNSYQSSTTSSQALDPATYFGFSPDVLMTATIDGQITLWDQRSQGQKGVGRLWMSDKTPPWCVSVRLLHYIKSYQRGSTP